MSDTCCYHCQLPINGKPLFHTCVAGIDQPMCCPGCMAVTEAIIAGGLEKYYQHRTDSAQQGEGLSDTLKGELLIYDRDDQQADFVYSKENGLKQANLLIEGITCAACIWLLEKHLTQITGVKSVHVNLSTHEAQITWSSDALPLSVIMLNIYRVGYKAYPWRADRQDALLKKENRRFIRRLAVAGIGAMQVMMYAIALYSGAISNDMSENYRDFIRYVSAIVATPVIFYAAMPFFKAALRDLKTRHLSMDTPVSIAIGGAYIASLWATYTGSGEVYFDSVCMFTFFLLTGRYLELKARHATAIASRTLSQSLPASCLKYDGSQWVRVPLSDLKVNDKVRVLPGDSIPADGILIQGRSSIDESMLSGEFMPVGKQADDKVLGGSINKDNTIEVRVTHTGNETQMASIVALLQRAQQEKPAIAKIADRLAGWFVLAVLVVACTVYVYWTGKSPENAFWITLSVLVVTCPCALSLATPMALTTATGALHKAGLLVTRGHVLEGLNNTRHIIFDKTGTLTQGNLVLAEILPFPTITHNPQILTELAAALEAHSEHPIAKAFSHAFSYTPFQAEHIINHTGKGLEGIIEGQCYRIGKPSFALQKKILPNPPGEGQWLLLSCENNPLCWFRITDSLRPEATSTIDALKATGRKVSLLSGDQEPVVATVAKTLGIEHWVSEASPADKLAFIRQCQSQGDKVLMVGDGINDVPVLAGADISLAMGNASDLARTSADAVLLSMDLRRLPETFALTGKTRKIIRENLGWALLYNVIALPLASAGLIAPWMAATGMSLSSLIVVTNALRLNRPVSNKAKASAIIVQHQPLKVS